MQELIEKFVEQGLTTEQAHTTLKTVNEWLQKNYPVAGTLLASLIKNNS